MWRKHESKSQGARAFGPQGLKIFQRLDRFENTCNSSQLVWTRRFFDCCGAATIELRTSISRQGLDTFALRMMEAWEDVLIDQQIVGADVVSLVCYYHRAGKRGKWEKSDVETTVSGDVVRINQYINNRSNKSSLDLTARRWKRVAKQAPVGCLVGTRKDETFILEIFRNQGATVVVSTFPKCTTANYDWIFDAMWAKFST